MGLADHAIGDVHRRREPERRRRRDDLLLKSRRNRHQLERRPGLVRVGDRAVPAPIRARRRKPVRVVAGRDRHGEHGARLGVHHDRGRRLGAIAAHGLGEDVLCVRLDLVVDREPDVLTRDLRTRADDVERAAHGILDDGLATGTAGEFLVEQSLEPLEAAVVHACEAEHLRGDAALRVGPQLLGVEAEPRKLQLLELRHRQWIRLARQIDESLRLVGQKRVNRPRLEAKRLRHRERDFLCPGDLPWVCVHRHRALADGQRVSVSVGDRPARRGHDDRLSVLPHGHCRVLGSHDCLEPERANESDRHERREDERENADAAVRGGCSHFAGRVT